VIAVILNPASGRHEDTTARENHDHDHEDAKTRREQRREKIEALFRDAGIAVQIYETSAPDMAATIRAALANGPDALVAAGGDGTVSAVAAALAGASTPLGVLPLGTLNHFAKDAGLPTDLGEAVTIIAGGHVKLVDVGCINDRVFVNNASIGVYPSVIERREALRRQGYSKWSAAAAATLEVLRRGDEVSIDVKANRSEFLARTPFLFVGNNEYLVEGIKLGERTRLDQGRLFAYFAPPVRTRDLPKLLARALTGRAGGHVLRSESSVELWVDAPYSREIKVACDGELLTLTAPLHCRSWARALGVLIPR
jgi:diacylglycerol kinase family enzyme